MLEYIKSQNRVKKFTDPLFCGKIIHIHLQSKTLHSRLCKSILMFPKVPCVYLVFGCFLDCYNDFLKTYKVPNRRRYSCGSPIIVFVVIAFLTESYL